MARPDDPVGQLDDLMGPTGMLHSMVDPGGILLLSHMCESVEDLTRDP